MDLSVNCASRETPQAARPLVFSIITCCWNSEPFIRQSIESVLMQDYPHIEYVFVDGGSTDGTLDTIRAIRRPVRLVTGVRGGISCAMNEGIRLATGDVVAHLHSDDYYLAPDVISRVARVFEATDAGWVFGSGWRDRAGTPEPEAWQVPKYSYRRLLKGNFIPHESTFVRRELLLRAGMFSERWKYGMDYDMWLKLGAMSEPVQLDLALAAFREHPMSFSTANAALAFEEDFEIRMSHAGRSPLAWLYHYAHYRVRKHRARRAARGGERTAS